MEPHIVEADEDLQNMPASAMVDVIHGLNQNDAWLTMAMNLMDGRGKKAVSDASLSQMKNNSSPGRQLIDILMRNNLRVRDLQAMLEKCQLYNILKLINTSEPAKILIPEKDSCYRVKLGSPKVEFFVEVCGSPFPDLQWYFNGKPMIGKTSPELSLENFSLKDVGEYTCKVKQRLHGAVSELTSPRYIFTADDSPSRIFKDLEDVEIKAYDDLTLSFEVTGYPEPQCFLWFKNNRFISRTEIPQLRRGKADVHSSGEYHCEVSNRAGSCTTRRALVKVKEISMLPGKPEIIKQPRTNKEYYAGDQICLSCEVLCSKPVEFACFLNKELLAKSSYIHDITTSVSRDRHKFELKYLLTKEQMDKENWKPLVFKFEVSSSAGRALSDDAHVKVKKRTVKESYFARNKWALLIGNSNYPQREKLPAAKCDLKILWKNFVELGFRVLVLTDLKRTEIQNAVRLFSTFLQKGDYVSFCYAGHGLHNDGKDYIIPLDASDRLTSKPKNAYIENTFTVSIDDCISHVSIFNILQESEPALIFSVYDTCRPMTPKYDGHQPLASQNAFPIALKNSFTIFGTSENYAAYENDYDNTSLLVHTLQPLMTRKIPVKELANLVLESFDIPSDSDFESGDKPQRPKIGGDLAKPLSLTDPSRPEDIDISENGVFMKWESLGGLGGSIQDSIALADTNVSISACWKGVSPPGGVTWVISNCLELEVTLSHKGHQSLQGLDVQIKLSNGKMASGKMGTELYVNFIIPHLQAFEGCLGIELLLTYRGQLYKKWLHLESPALSQQFYRGNYI